MGTTPRDPAGSGTGAPRRRSLRTFTIGTRSIGDAPTYLIAEAGVNHGGDVGMALRLIDAAARAGADAVKFQTFEPDGLASAAAPKAGYQRAIGEPDGGQLEMLRRLRLESDAWATLRDHARNLGIEFLSSPFDVASADLLDRLDVPAFKVGSGELTNLPFLANLARRGRPLLISTGMAEMTEVAAAVDAVAAAGNPPLALLHCVSSYPAALEDANLRAIETMRHAFAVPVGWSDHTRSQTTTLTAVALGAAIIERHLTLDRTLPGPDHQASLDPDEFAVMVAGVRAVEASLGTGVKQPVEAERQIAAVARRSLHWTGDHEAGHLIDADDVEALRPGTGIAPSRLADVIGRRTSSTVRGGEMIRQTDVEGLR